MNLPQWIKPALLGAGAGAIVLAIVGFSWGGWVTGGSAATLATTRANAAVAEALTPYCIERAQTATDSATALAALKAASSYQRSGLVEKAGWATPLGAEKPNSQLAQACQLALVAGL